VSGPGSARGATVGVPSGDRGYQNALQWGCGTRSCRPHGREQIRLSAVRKEADVWVHSCHSNRQAQVQQGGPASEHEFPTVGVGRVERA
jgi:hypothetical protein